MMAQLKDLIPQITSHASIANQSACFSVRQREIERTKSILFKGMTASCLSLLAHGEVPH
jgi:hypothetical protein